MKKNCLTEAEKKQVYQKFEMVLMGKVGMSHRGCPDNVKGFLRDLVLRFGRLVCIAKSQLKKEMEKEKADFDLVQQQEARNQVDIRAREEALEGQTSNYLRLMREEEMERERVRQQIARSDATDCPGCYVQDSNSAPGLYYGTGGN